MPNIDEISNIKNSLKKTKIRVTLEDGSSFDEQRNDSDSFEVISDANTDCKSTDYSPSNRMQNSLVSKRIGFILDLNPDMQVACVADGIYLSSQDVAQDFEILKRTGISHIVNVATGIKNCFPEFFKYLSINAVDFPTQNLKKYFREALLFMRDAVEGNGKVLVHCNAGISRSSTIVIAYIMGYGNKSFQSAYDQVKAIRAVARPNFGFVNQLKEFESELEKAPIKDWLGEKK